MLRIQQKRPWRTLIADARFARDKLGAHQSPPCSGYDHGRLIEGRCARPVIYVSRGLNIVSNVLGLGNHAPAASLTIGISTFALSVAVIALLIGTRRQAQLATG